MADLVIMTKQTPEIARITRSGGAIGMVRSAVAIGRFARSKSLWYVTSVGILVSHSQLSKSPDWCAGDDPTLQSHRVIQSFP